MTNTAVADRAVLEQRRHRGLNWFYWIAALSAINTVMFAADAKTHFVIGLAISELSDGIFAALHAAPIGWIIDAIICGGFVALGMGARKNSWPFIVGMIVYGLDGLLYVFFQGWMSVAFHVWALVNIFAGFNAAQQLARLAPPPQAVVPDMITITPQPLPPAPQ